LQHLANLNTVYTLALLQEEVADDAKKCEFHISDHGASTKAQARTTFHVLRAPVHNIADERIKMPKRGVNWAFLKINCKN
jgi:hypothetical protein